MYLIVRVAFVVGDGDVNSRIIIDVRLALPFFGQSVSGRWIGDELFRLSVLVFL
jgi:hypothetical protein